MLPEDPHSLCLAGKGLLGRMALLAESTPLHTIRLIARMESLTSHAHGIILSHLPSSLAASISPANPSYLTPDTPDERSSMSDVPDPPKPPANAKSQTSNNRHNQDPSSRPLLPPSPPAPVSPSPKFHPLPPPYLVILDGICQIIGDDEKLLLASLLVPSRMPSQIASAISQPPPVASISSPICYPLGLAWAMCSDAFANDKLRFVVGT